MPDATPKTVIEFYSTTGEYKCFSNFSRPWLLARTVSSLFGRRGGN